MHKEIARIWSSFEILWTKVCRLLRLLPHAKTLQNAMVYKYFSADKRKNAFRICKNYNEFQETILTSKITLTVQMKNWLALVLGPALAILTTPGPRWTTNKFQRK